MKKRLFVFILLILLVLLISNLNASVLSGKIVDIKTKNRISDANIKIIEISKVVSSNNHGEFIFKSLSDGTYHILITHIAYDQSDTIEVKVSGESFVEIELIPTPWILNDVVVTGTRSPHLLKDVPVQTEVITPHDFQRTGATTVDEALSSAIGVNINEDLSGQGATIRGIEGDRVLILIDGERAVGRVRGSIDLSQYSLNNVEKIEIVKGTGSTLYGSDAMGGVINIITKKPNASRGSLDLFIDYGTHDKINPSIDLEYGNQRTAVQLGGKFFTTSGFDLDESTPHTNGQEEIIRYNFSGKVKHNINEKWNSTLSGRYMFENKDWIESEIIYLRGVFVHTDSVYDAGSSVYIYIDSVFAPTDSAIVPYLDDETNERFEGSLNLDYLSGDKYSMKFRFFGTMYLHNWNKFNQKNGNWEDTSDTEDIFWEASYTSNYVIGVNHVATYGFDYNYQDLESTELVNTKEADESFAGYLQYEYQPTKKLDVVLGNRYEHHSSFGAHYNPSINLMYKASEQTKIRGFVGRGFRAPSIKEQFFVFDHTSAGYIVYGGYAADPETFKNADFNPLIQETSINSSISAEFSYGSMGLHRITYFYNHLEDLIDFQLIDFNGGYWRGRYVYQNIETAITQGIEWESRVRLSNTFDMSFSYNYLYSRNLETGEKLINRPDHTFKFFLNGLLEKWNLGGSLYGDYSSRKLWEPRSNTGGNENSNEQGETVITEARYAPSRTNINLNIFKRFNGGVETFLRMENILDETEVEFGYWPGREVFVGIKYNLNK